MDRSISAHEGLEPSTLTSCPAHITTFSALLATGLRETELVSLNLSHYHSRGFHHVKRKGNIFTKKIPIPDEPEKYLDQYFISRYYTI